MSLNESRFHPLLSDSHCSSTHGATGWLPRGREQISCCGQDGWPLQGFLILSWFQGNREVSTELENVLRGHRFSFQLISQIKLNMAILSPNFSTTGGKPNSRPESATAVNNTSNLCCVIAPSKRVSEFWVMIQTLIFNSCCPEFLVCRMLDQK